MGTVRFETVDALAKALLDGRRFVTLSPVAPYSNRNVIEFNRIHGKFSVETLLIFLYLPLVELMSIFERIKNGEQVLCWAGDGVSKGRMVVIVDADNGEYFDHSGQGYISCREVDDAELAKIGLQRIATDLGD